MITLLSRLLIRNRNDTDDPAVRRAYGVLCSAVGIFLNLVLFGIKYAAGVISGSIAITADAFNNLSDAGSSVVTLLGFKLAAKKPHRDHPYGHGRIEYVAGLIVSMVILLVGFTLGRDSIQKIIHPEMMEFSIVSVVILAASILVKLYMAVYNRAVGKRIDSATVRAVATDSLSDVCATAAVLISMLVYRFFGVNIDAWAGALVAVMILRAGYSAAKDTISPLLGNPPTPEFVQHIRDIVREYPDIVGVHDLAVHDYGAGRVMISLHAEVPASGDIVALHDVIDTIERRLSEELNCTAVIHMDPISTDDQQINDTKAAVLARVHADLDASISIHDFRMVAGPTHTNVIFDIVVPFGFRMTDAQAAQAVAQIVRQIDDHYFAIVTVDHPLAQEN